MSRLLLFCLLPRMAPHEGKREKGSTEPPAQMEVWIPKWDHWAWKDLAWLWLLSPYFWLLVVSLLCCNSSSDSPGACRSLAVERLRVHSLDQAVAPLRQFLLMFLL